MADFENEQINAGETKSGISVNDLNFEMTHLGCERTGLHRLNSLLIAGPE
jgi:hypothetical protein